MIIWQRLQVTTKTVIVQYHKCREKTQFGFCTNKENRHIVRNGAISQECMQGSIPGERGITFVSK